MTTLRIGYYIVTKTRRLIFIGEKIEKAGDAIWAMVKIDELHQAKLPYFESEISVILHQTIEKLELLHFEDI